jgi:peroxiredoxin Q/BCP
MTYLWLAAALVLVVGLIVWRALRPGAPGVEAGSLAPAFSLIGSDGRTHTLADLRGRSVVVAWFPKAFTGG